jgi:hypothetical protein
MLGSIIGSFRENPAQTQTGEHPKLELVNAENGALEYHVRGRCTSFARTGELVNSWTGFALGKIKFPAQLIDAAAPRAVNPCVELYWEGPLQHRSMIVARSWCRQAEFLPGFAINAR